MPTTELLKGDWICARCSRQFNNAITTSCLACHSTITLSAQLQADLMLALLMTGETVALWCSLDKDGHVQTVIADELDQLVGTNV